MKPAYIHLIRHGESEGNVDRSAYERIPDHRIQLTDTGETQAAEAGARFREILNGEGVAIYSSPFVRARQTRGAIIQAIDTSQVRLLREDPRLREQEYGHLRLQKEMARIERERDEFGAFYYRIPDGESGADVYDRASSFLDTLFRDFDKPEFPRHAIIVSHGLFIRLFLMRWFKWTPEEFDQKRNPRNCEIFTMAAGADGKFTLVAPFPERPAVKKALNFKTTANDTPPDAPRAKPRLANPPAPPVPFAPGAPFSGCAVWRF